MSLPLRQFSESRVKEIVDGSKQDLTKYATITTLKARLKSSSFVSKKKVLSMINDLSLQASETYDTKLKDLRTEVSDTCNDLRTSIDNLNRELRTISNNNSGIAKALLQLQLHLPRDTKKQPSPAIRRKKSPGAKKK